MSTMTAPVEHVVVLHNVGWETYERLLADHEDQSGTHFIYDEGELEIMVASRRHERPNRILAALVSILSEEFGIPISEEGSMTFKREALQKGFEPDSAFYVARAAEMEAIDDEDVTAENAPGPDLIIEVDVTSMSLPRFPIYAAFGVAEIWRHKKGRVSFFRLEQGQYAESQSSLAFPLLKAETANKFVQDRKRMNNIRWTRQVREWARAQQAR
jgi:Uma2 family endonuclease